MVFSALPSLLWEANAVAKAPDWSMRWEASLMSCHLAGGTPILAPTPMIVPLVIGRPRK